MPAVVVGRVRALAAAFVETDLVRLRVKRGDEEIELRRSSPQRVQAGDALAVLVSRNGTSGEAGGVAQLETIKAELVGIVHLSRPAPKDGEVLDADRELASVEALGIRNPVRSRGKGRITAVRCQEGAAVEYGQPLFEIERS